MNYSNLTILVTPKLTMLHPYVAQGKYCPSQAPVTLADAAAPGPWGGGPHTHHALLLSESRGDELAYAEIILQCLSTMVIKMYLLTPIYQCIELPARILGQFGFRDFQVGRPGTRQHETSTKTPHRPTRTTIFTASLHQSGTPIISRIVPDRSRNAIIHHIYQTASSVLGCLIECYLTYAY